VSVFPPGLKFCQIFSFLFTGVSTGADMTGVLIVFREFKKCSNDERHVFLNLHFRFGTMQAVLTDVPYIIRK